MYSLQERIRKIKFISIEFLPISRIDIANGPYHGIKVGAATFIDVVGNPDELYNVYKEQVGVSLVLLFQSICEYPRNINKYINNTHFVLVTGRAELDASFLHNSIINNAYCTAIRFRNWMRYGVSNFLQVIEDTAMDAFNVYNPTTDPTTAMITNNKMITKNNLQVILPWSKILGSQNPLFVAGVGTNNDSSLNYSAFKINYGSHTSRAHNNCPGARPAGQADNPGCYTVFESYRQLDNGLAYLRGPGAFFSPNHFFKGNDNFTYDNVG